MTHCVSSPELSLPAPHLLLDFHWASETLTRPRQSSWFPPICFSSRPPHLTSDQHHQVVTWWLEPGTPDSCSISSAPSAPTSNSPASPAILVSWVWQLAQCFGHPVPPTFLSILSCGNCHLVLCHSCRPTIHSLHSKVYTKCTSDPVISCTNLSSLFPRLLE